MKHAIRISAIWCCGIYCSTVKQMWFSKYISKQLRILIYSGFIAKTSENNHGRDKETPLVSSKASTGAY